MGARNSIIVVPPDVTNPEDLRRFLSKLVEQIDVVLGNSGNTNFSELVSIVDTIVEQDTVIAPTASTITLSATYVQAEMNQVQNDLNGAISVISDILDLLQNAGIMRRP